MADEILDSWEELDDNEILDKKLKGIKVSEPKGERTSAEVSTMKEEGSRTQYAPRVRILKRQTDSSTANANVQKSQSTPQKTLEQREAEYKEARLRIMGENYSASAGNTNNSADISENRPIKLVQHVEELKYDKKVEVLRQPKGPDGTGGFGQNR